MISHLFGVSRSETPAASNSGDIDRVTEPVNADGNHGLTLLIRFTLAELRGPRATLFVTFLP